jgi:hypothetical protein
MRRFEIPPPSSSRPIETDDIPPHSRSSNKRPIKGRQLFPETSTRQNESWCEFAGLWQCRLGSAFVDLMSLDPNLVRRAKQFELDLAKFSHCNAHFDRVQARASVQKALAYEQTVQAAFASAA